MAKIKSKNKETLILVITLGSFFVIVILASVFDVGQNTFVGKVFNFRPRSSNFTQNCQNPENKNTPYCQDRIAEKESTWKSMGSGGGGGGNGQFTLHKKW